MRYFTMTELTRTSTGIKNEPNEEQIRNLHLLVDNVLDPAREELGMPIFVNSGYRSYSVNKAVGGSYKSDHMKGMAVDIKCGEMTKLWNILKRLPHKQLINEFSFSWIHVSYDKDNLKNQNLAALKIDGRTIYKNITK